MCNGKGASEGHAAMQAILLTLANGYTQFSSLFGMPQNFVYCVCERMCLCM